MRGTEQPLFKAVLIPSAIHPCPPGVAADCNCQPAVSPVDHLVTVSQLNCSLDLLFLTDTVTRV